MKSKSVTAAALGILLGACSGSYDAGQANQPPMISTIEQQNTVANAASTPVAFSVDDERPGTLTISAMSDRQQVVSDDGLSLAGNGTERTITVTPVADATGDAFITIIATDANGLSTSTSFLLVVEPEQRSMQQFARDAFATDADDDPVLVNALEFIMDAEADDFADLLVP